VVGSEWSSDSDPVIYQIAFEFERRGVTGEDRRAGQLECGLCRGVRKARGPFSSRSPCVCRVPRLGPRSVAGEMVLGALPLAPVTAPYTHRASVEPRKEPGRRHAPPPPHALDRSGSDEF
jgi:hypothetical protein